MLSFPPPPLLFPACELHYFRLPEGLPYITSSVLLPLVFTLDATFHPPGLNMFFGNADCGDRQIDSSSDVNVESVILRSLPVALARVLTF